MLEKLKDLPKPVKIILVFFVLALILGLLSACTKPGMRVDTESVPLPVIIGLAAAVTAGVGPF